MKKITLGFYGFGKLAQTLYHGFSEYLISNNFTTLVHTRTQPTESFSNINFVSSEILLNQSDIVILGVKPQQLNDIMPILSTFDWNKTCLVSLLAGVPISSFTSQLTNLNHAFRVMPNTSAHVQQSMTTYAYLESTDPLFDVVLNDLFSIVGSFLNISESQLDFCTALCGSGPAFFLYLFQSLSELATHEGFSNEDARLMINQLIKGIAESIITRPESFDHLINEICSPNGTTEAGLKKCTELQLAAQWQSVVNSAKDRSIELSQLFKSS